MHIQQLVNNFPEAEPPDVRDDKAYSCFLGPDAVFRSSTLYITSHKLADMSENRRTLDVHRMQSFAPIIGMVKENIARHSGLMANTDG